MKKVLIALLIALPLQVSAAVPRSPVLGKAEIKSSTHIRWHFSNRAKDAVAFELWDVLARRMVSRVDDPRATYIDETNIVPADPDMACGRYVVAVNAKDERSFGQIETYACVRTPPVTPPLPVVEIIDGKIIRITLDQGANDPATGIGVYEAERGNWVSPEHLFVADPIYPTLGQWNAREGVMLIGLQPNTSYRFYVRAQSVTGEVSAFSKPVSVRMPAEVGDKGAPILDRVGELKNLRSQTLLQTFISKDRAPIIAGLVATGSHVTVDIDDRPYAAIVAPSTGALTSFWVQSPKLAPGLHRLRFGSIKDGVAAWTPTIELRIK